MSEVPANLHVQLLKAKAASAAASRANGEFLTSLSYEVRTAINSIIGLTNTVLGTELNPEQRADLIAVRDSKDSLLMSLDDALAYFKSAERHS